MPSRYLIGNQSYISLISFSLSNITLMGRACISETGRDEFDGGCPGRRRTSLSKKINLTIQFGWFAGARQNALPRGKNTQICTNYRVRVKRINNVTLIRTRSTSFDWWVIASRNSGWHDLLKTCRCLGMKDHTAPYLLAFERGHASSKPETSQH